MQSSDLKAVKEEEAPVADDAKTKSIINSVQTKSQSGLSQTLR